VRVLTRTRRRTSDRPRPAVCRTCRRIRIPSPSRVSLSFHLSRNCGGWQALRWQLSRSTNYGPPVILAPGGRPGTATLRYSGRNPVKHGNRRRLPEPQSPGESAVLVASGNASRGRSGPRGKGIRDPLRYHDSACGNRRFKSSRSDQIRRACESGAALPASAGSIRSAGSHSDYYALPSPLDGNGSAARGIPTEVTET
jgi:hypothetical protein